MAAVVKQDGNFTNCRYAVEVTPGVLSGSDVWRQMEPNSYKKFGAEIKTKARMPISEDRQLRKGVVVDLDAAVEIEQDLTPENSSDLMQTFFFAAFRTKNELTATAVDGSANAYTVASGGMGYAAGDLLFAKYSDDDENKGLKVVTSGVTATSVPVTDTSLVTATGQAITISKVGVQFGSGVASIDANGGEGGVPRLVITGNTAASRVFTVGGGGSVIQDGNTITITGPTGGAVVYTWQTVLTVGSAGAVHVLIGANDTAALLNMKRAINATGGTEGVDYDTTGTGANDDVTGSASNATTLTVTAIVTGVVGNSITVAEVSSGSWASGTLTGGVGYDLTTLGLIQGEPVFLGDDSNSAYAFAQATDAGFCRIKNIGTAYLDFDKTQSIMVDDNGSGKTLRMFFARIVKNESTRTLIIKRPVQFERTLGYIDTSTPTQVQAEYVIRCYGGKLKIDTKTADLVTLNMEFLGSTNELKTGAQGVKAGTRPTLPELDAFNATSDLSLSKMALVVAGNACPSPLFSYMTNFVIDVDNNLKQNKAIGYLGAFDVTPGFFEVGGAITAYFVDVAEMQAVKDNSDITIEAHYVKENRGFSIDIPLVCLSKAMADVKANEAVMIPLDAKAAAGRKVDAGLNHTLLMAFWDYLPDLAD